MRNILIGGAAGQGIETTAAILGKLLKRSGYCVFTKVLALQQEHSAATRSI